MPIKDLFEAYSKPNIVIIITDQQRALQHYPDDFINKLPALQQLMNNGLSFERAFTAASACAPSRGSSGQDARSTNQLIPLIPLI